MTADLKPYPAYKPSGVAWLGDVPSHWDIRRFKFLLREHDSRSLNGQEQLLSVSQYTGVSERSQASGGNITDTRAASLVGYKQVDRNDLVINIMLAWNGSMGVSDFHGIVSPSYCVYRFLDGVVPQFFHHLLRSPMYKAYIRSASTGVVESRLRLYTDDLYGLYAISPPVTEQAAIARYLDAADTRIQRYISAKERLVELLTEQKQAIINHAVTRGLDPNVRLRPSGVEWLGDVPAHWEVRRLKTICEMKSGDGIDSMSIEPTGKYPVYGGNGIRGYASDYTHDGDFVLVGRQGALCGNIHLARGRFWASEHAVVVTLRVSQDLIWFGYILEAMNLNQYSISAAQPGLSVERVLNLSLPIPPPQEQSAITKSIVEATSEIDAAIARAQRQVELMTEYRARLIADVVTGKVDVCEAA